jgi:hypothetical protein
MGPICYFAVLMGANAVPRCAAQESATAVLSAEQNNRLAQILAIDDPAMFADQASAFWKLRSDWTAGQTQAVRQSIGDRAKQLVQGTTNLVEIDLGAAQVLLGMAATSMSPAEKEKLKSDIESTYSAPDTATFGQLRSRVTLASGLVNDPSETKQQGRQLVENWLKHQDLSALPSSQLLECFRFICPATKVQGGFRVTWTGYLTPTRTGPHVFSVSPRDVSTEKVEDGELVRNQQYMTVHVDEKVIVDAKPSSWQYEGAPIDLTAGEAVPLRIEVTYSYTSNDHHRACPAILYWRAPGVGKSVVPPGALAVQVAGASGLQGEYSWKDEKSGNETSELVVDPNIDFVWVDALTLRSRDPVAQQLASELVSRWIRPDGDFVGDVARRPQISVLLTTVQLHDCLQSILEHAEKLADVSQARMARFYDAIRCAGQESAVDVLGTWMTKHDYIEPGFAANLDEYFDLNRVFYFRLAQFIAADNREAMKQLEQQYLEASDGCCLNTANALAECHLMLGTIPEWIDELDARLADESLTGDRRVAWLIARSEAEELRYSTANRYYRTPEQLLAGQGWLDEAALMAESPEQKLRVARERIARLVALGRWEAVEVELTSAESYSPNARTEVFGWRSNIETVKTRQGEQAKSTEQLAQDAYRATLQRRRVKASERGDLDAVKSYDLLLTKTAKSNSDQ